MIQATLLDHMGTDLTVSNVARVSFNKWKDEFDAGDAKLIGYLADHNHTSPFRHCFASFRCRAPILVHRQLVKHEVGMDHTPTNEVSLRYVTAGDVWRPAEWREQVPEKKQGSGGPIENQARADLLYNIAVGRAVETYELLLDMGVCREQARAVLPVSVYTEWVWSGSLQAFAHMCKLRCAQDAQQETRELAEQIRAELVRIWPVAMAALGVAE